MNMKRIPVILFLLLISFSLESQTRIEINPAVTYQTINSFGASDCWCMNDVGKYWTEDVKNQIARYLFSTNTKPNGSPEGIGLSMWRFNLGAGTVELGDGNGNIDDPNRRSEWFLNDEGTEYDWSKQSGQQWFMDKAREYGCDNFVAFSNSPLVKYTINGQGYANPGSSVANLKEDMYDDYAEYVGDVMKHFEDQGKGFKFFSPVNEPQYNWDGPGQEGSPWHNWEIKKLVTELDKSFTKRNLSTKLLIAEAADWTNLYTSKGRASNQIYEFFNPESDNYIADLPSVPSIIGGHSYWTTGTDVELKNVRTNTDNAAKRYNLEVYQTEWSELSGGEGIPQNLDEASYMDHALFLAKVIHSDLTFANVTSWAYWTAVSIEAWGHKNRFLLISLLPGGESYYPLPTPGLAIDSKTLWTLGNYSYFIRPGYKRICMKGATELSGLMGSAYISPDESRIVAVYVNMDTKSRTIKPEFVNLPYKPLTNKRYITDSTYDFLKYGSASSETYVEGKEFSIPARSVMTFVYDLDKSLSGINETKEKLGIYPNPVKKGEELTIHLPQTDTSGFNTLSLSALNGSLLFKEKIYNKDNPLIFDIPSWIPSGIAMLSVENKNMIYKEKIMIR